MPTATRSLRDRPAKALLRLLWGTLTLLVFTPALALDITTLRDDANALSRKDPAAAIALVSERIAQLDPGASVTQRLELLLLRAALQRDGGTHAEALADMVHAEALLGNDGALELRARILHMEGTIAAEQGNVARAIENFHTARQLLEAEGDSEALAQVTIALGVAYNFLNNAERARDYYLRALAQARALDHADFTLTALGNLAVVISELEGPEAGLALHRETLALAEQQGKRLQVGYQLGNICNRQMDLNDLAAARESCEQALAALGNSARPRVLSGIQMTVGDLARRRGDLDSALDHYQQALATAGDFVLPVQASLLQRLGEVYRDRGEDALAADHLQRLLVLREEMRLRERDELTEELEIRYAVGQAAHEIELLRLHNALQVVELGTRNRLVAGILGALIGALVLLLWIARSHRRLGRLRRDLHGRNQELESALATIRELADRDPLTGLLNRRALLALARKEQSRARRNGTPLAIALGDIDHFKQLNDRYGHQAGDAVLRELARRMQSQLRDIDIVSRWGGEEFLCLLPGDTPAQAAITIERLRKALSEPVQTDAGPLCSQVTFGVAAVTEDLEQAIQSADQALYEGKASGRNQVITARPADRNDHANPARSLPAPA